MSEENKLARARITWQGEGMSNYDWSKVTAAQLRSVPQSVLNYVRLAVFDDYASLYGSANNQVACIALNGRGTWSVFDNRIEESRSVIACIDRIANYLTIHGGGHE